MCGDEYAEKFSKNDIHIHVPEAQYQKMVQSAGITITTALVSIIKDIPVRNDIAMTGEITLRGRILPVGGIKEKVLAAYRKGINTVIMPKKNEVDLEKIPKDVCEKMKFVFVQTIDEVLEVALCDKSKQEKSDAITKKNSGKRRTRKGDSNSKR